MSVIKIKRSGTTGSPSSLGQGELAYSYTAIYRESNGSNIWEVSLTDGSLVKTFIANSTGYGISIDYGNKYLYLGGLNNTTMLRFPGV